MKQLPIICITLYKRERQTRAFFEHLERCRGFENHHYLINIDGDTGFSDIHKVWIIARQFMLDHPDVDIQLFNDHGNQGVDATKTFLLEKAFAVGEWAILFEDDTYPCVHALDYFTAQIEHFTNYPDENLVGICAYNYHHSTTDTPDYTNQMLFVESSESFPWWTPWGWCMHRDKYNEIFDPYKGRDINGVHDTIIGNYMKMNPEAFSVRPPISHIKLIDAAEGATHTPSQEWFEENEKTFFYSDMLIEPIKEKDYGTFLNRKPFKETLLCPHQAIDPDAEHFTAVDGGSTEIEYLEILKAFIGVFKPTHCMETGTWMGSGTSAILQALQSVPGDCKQVLSICGDDLPEEVYEGLSDIAEESGVGFKFLKANTNKLMDENTWSRFTEGKTTFAFLDSSIPDRVREFEYISNPSNGVLDFDRPLCVCVHDMSKYRHPKDDATEYLKSTVDGLYQIADERGWEVLRLNQSRGLIILVRYPFQG